MDWEIFDNEATDADFEMAPDTIRLPKECE